MEPMVVMIPRTEEQGFFLVHVSSEGRQPLGLKLIGTEGENVFGVSLKDGVKMNPGCEKSSFNQEQLSQILSASTVTTACEDGTTYTDGVEVVAEVCSAEANITIQKRIEGIIQKLGGVRLQPSEDEVSLFDWCSLVIKSRDEAHGEVHRLKAALKEKDVQIKKLDEGYAELVRLKAEYEDQLLEKLSLLLNEKKLKIRDQQRLLGASKSDLVRPEAVAASRIAVRSGQPEFSEKGKRKASAAPSDEDSESGFEPMEVDDGPDDEKVAKTSDEKPYKTDSSATDSEDEYSPIYTSARRPNNRQINRPNNSSQSVALPEDVVVPPKRVLPFATRASSTESDNSSHVKSDDEL